MGIYCELCMGENIDKPYMERIEVQLATYWCPHCSTRMCNRHWKETNECSCGGKEMERKLGYG